MKTKIVAAAFIILEKDGKILLIRRANTGYQDGKYEVPSGHVEEGEMLTVAAAREAKEEVNADILPENLEFVHLIYKPKHDPTGDRANIFFRAKVWSGEVKNMEPNKCDDIKWVGWDELPESFVPDTREALQNIQKGIFFKEYGIDWLKKNGLYSL